MNTLSFSGAPRIALILLLTSLLTWEGAAQTCPQVPEPCVKVATISSASSTTYFYRVLNTSPFKITSLHVGFDSVGDEALLDVPPMSGTAPSGWTWEYIRTEEEARWHASWFNPEPGIPAGTTLAGFSLTTATLSQAYLKPIVTVHYGLSPVSASAQVEGDVRPIKVCVERLSGGAFKAYFSYKNTNSTETTISIGPANFFSPDPQDRGQPTTFQPGEPTAAPFAVMSNGEALTWTVEGTSVTATGTDRACM
jgi:hypothetical protein